MKIPAFFRRKKVISIHMKSGAVLKIKCDNLTTKTNHNQDIVSYKIDGQVGATAHYIRLDDISAITVAP